MKSRLPFVVLAVALLLGSWLRIGGITEPGLFGDEYHTISVGDAELGTLLTKFDKFGSHVVTPSLQWLSLSLIGEGVLSFRLIGLVPGLLTLWLFFWIARFLLGEGSGLPAALATLLLALNPMHIYYSRFGRGYALIVLLALLLVFFTTRAHRSQSGTRQARLAWAGVIFTAGALPVTHLSSAGLVAFVGLASFVLALRRGGLSVARAPLQAFAAALLIAVAALSPVLSQVQEYFAQTAEVKDQPATWLGIPILLAGGPVAAAWLLALPFAWFGLLRKRQDAAWILAASIAGPLTVLLITRPHGMEYAWARYLLAALPFLPLLTLWWIHAALTRRSKAAEFGTIVAALLMIGTALGGTKPATGTFDNTYLAMHPLPAFDEPWPDASPFYDELAKLPGDVLVVETTALVTRSVLLYRNHALKHGKQVRLGWPGGLTGAIAGEGPYLDVRQVTAAQADYIIVHRDLPREVRAYWRFVYESAWPALESGLDTGFMKRHEATFIASQVIATPAFVAEIASALRTRLGPAYYKDDQVLVWKLSP